MYDFSSYNRISLEPSSLRTPAARKTHCFKGFLRCEKTLCARDALAIAATTANTRLPLLGSPLFCSRERCTDRCLVVVHEGRFFLKNGARHCESDMRIKVACVGIRFFVTTVVTTVGRYYDRMTAVVTTVAT